MKKYTLNPKKTLAILIGTSEYDHDFEPIRQVQNNITELSKVLTNPAIFGINAATDLKIILDVDNVEMEDQLDEYIQEGIKNGKTTLILYFAGHGFKRSNGEYFLIAKNTRKRTIQRSGRSALSYQTVKDILNKAKIKQKIVLLDACHSGLSVQGEEDLNDFEIKGTYTIASCDSLEYSYFDSDDKHTVFTGVLLDILNQGLAIEEEKISLQTLYQSLYSQVKKKKPKMSPQQKASKEITGDNFLFFKNKQFDKEAVKKRLIYNLINEGDQLVAEMEYEQAIEKYRLALSKARPRSLFQAEMEILDNKMDTCEKDLELYEYFKIKMETDFKIKLENKEQIIRILQQKNQKLIAKILYNEKESIGLMKIVKKEEVFVEKLQKKYVQLEKMLKDKTRQINKLKKELEQKNTEIIKLRQALPIIKRPPQIIQAGSKNFTVNVGNIPFEMVFIKGGTFLMGNEHGYTSDNEQTAHQVTLSYFYIGKYLVTQEQWEIIMGGNPSHFEGQNLPVESVSWGDIQRFIKKINQKTAKNFRLLTEAEWEYAANGKERLIYVGSDDIGEVAWYDGNSNGKTHPVGQKKANGYGLYDMSGNVWECCQDWYGAYPSEAQTNPQGTENGTFRVLRGGGWDASRRYCGVFDRYGNTLESGYNDIGFRLAHS